MSNSFFARYRRAFGEILFLRPWPEELRDFGMFTKISLYALAGALFYVPALWFMILKCAENPVLILYFAAMTAVHVLAKFMLHSSKRIRARFSTLKSKKRFLMRTWLIIEYVVFMWLVYLFYPLSCILFPFSLISMFAESLFGGSFLLGLFVNYSEQFILYGGIVSYILFIVADGYKKLRAGFLPDYLGLYAILTVVSRSIEAGTQKLAEHTAIDMSSVTSVMSQILRLSNDAMSIVASAITLFFAVYSLYSSTQDEPPEEDVPDETEEDYEEEDEHKIEADA